MKEFIESWLVVIAVIVFTAWVMKMLFYNGVGDDE